jgi:hypothetical protein
MRYQITVTILLLVSSISVAKEKIAQTGFQFLSVVSDAYSASVGEAVTSLDLKSASMFFNPAGMAVMSPNLDFSVSMNKWIADINHTSLSLAYNPSFGEYGVFGLTIQSVDYGELEGTILAKNFDGFIETGNFSPTAIVFGFGYARSLTEKFSVGVHLKRAYQRLGDNAVTQGETIVSKRNIADAIAFDFGTRFTTGYKGIVFGMSVRNFSEEVKFEKEGFQLPLNFTIGISANVLEWINITPGIDHSLLLTMDATHPRSHREQVKIGFDYKLQQILSLRTGFIGGNDEDAFSYGVGLNYSAFCFDYAYSPFGVFNNVQRFTVRITY